MGVKAPDGLLKVSELVLELAVLLGKVLELMSVVLDSVVESFIGDLLVALVDLSSLDWLDDVHVDGNSLLEGLVVLDGLLDPGLGGDLDVLFSLNLDDLLLDHIVVLDDLSVDGHVSVLDDLLIDGSLDLVLDLDEDLGLDWHGLLNNLEDLDGNLDLGVVDLLVELGDGNLDDVFLRDGSLLVHEILDLGVLNNLGGLGLLADKVVVMGLDLIDVDMDIVMLVFVNISDNLGLDMLVDHSVVVGGLVDIDVDVLDSLSVLVDVDNLLDVLLDGDGSSDDVLPVDGFLDDVLDWLLDYLLNGDGDVVLPVVGGEVGSVDDVLDGLLNNSLNWSHDDFLNEFLDKVLLVISVENWSGDIAVDVLVVDLGGEDMGVSVLVQISDVAVDVSVVVDNILDVLLDLSGNNLSNGHINVSDDLNWLLDDLLDWDLDDLLDWDLNVLLDDPLDDLLDLDLLLDDSLDWLLDEDIIRDIDVDYPGDLSLDDDLDLFFDDPLYNDGLLLVGLDCSSDRFPWGRLVINHSLGEMVEVLTNDPGVVVLGNDLGANFSLAQDNAVSSLSGLEDLGLAVVDGDDLTLTEVGVGVSDRVVVGLVVDPALSGAVVDLGMGGVAGPQAVVRSGVGLVTLVVSGPGVVVVVVADLDNIHVVVVVSSEVLVVVNVFVVAGVGVVSTVVAT